jgi:hypothetical protein
MISVGFNAAASIKNILLYKTLLMNKGKTALARPSSILHPVVYLPA